MFLPEVVERMTDKLSKICRAKLPEVRRAFQKIYYVDCIIPHPHPLARVNTRPFSVFCHLRWCSGGATPARILKLSIAELSGKSSDCSRGVLAVGGAFFYPRSIFYPVMSGQRSNFREIDFFFTLHAYISNTMNRSDIKLHQRVPPSKWSVVTIE